MSASIAPAPLEARSSNWEAREEKIACLLEKAARATVRAELLREIDDYSLDLTREAHRLGPVPPDAGTLARASRWLSRPVFLCGHHRTGTTLLHNLLDGHPALVVLPSEGTYLTSFRYVARPEATDADVDRFAAEWVSRFIDPNYAPHFVIGRARANVCPSLEFVRRLLGWYETLTLDPNLQRRFVALLALAAAYSQSRETRVEPEAWVEKTPLNESHAQELAAAFPKARFIQMVRRPSDTLASVLEIFRQAGHDDGHRFARAISIRRSFVLARANSDHLGDRYRIQRFEDLTDAPEREMDAIRLFLGLAPDPILTVPTVQSIPVRANSSQRPAQAGIVHRTRDGPPVPETDAALATVLAGRAARKFGYEGTHLPALTAKALVASEALRYALRRASGLIRAAWRASCGWRAE